jgi:DNA mismatch repair protein MutL
VANKIAAGEVVERPASVFKELFENSVDAKSTRIDVEVSMGGKKALIITDDGIGMSRDDALLSIERHATSKIHDVDDIEEINTFGFRGEALPSIASVSRFTLTTRTHDALEGTELVISGGKILEVNDAGCPPGTSIAVRNLFFNVPARKKFLKTEQTELANIRQLFQVYAIAHPEINLQLVVDEREVARYAGGTSLEDRLHELYGQQLIENLRPINHSFSGVKITGYAGLPQHARKDRRDQYIFINRRPAGAALVNYAINQAYQSMLPRNMHPVLFMFIELQPGMVDVNVHPTKREVRFRESNIVRDAIISALEKAVLKKTAGAGGDHEELELPVTAAPPTPAPSSATPSAARQAHMELPGTLSRKTFDYPNMPLELPEQSHSEATTASEVLTVAQQPVEDNPNSPWKWCRVISRIGEIFVLLETEDGLVIMDPQAGHERVMYERMIYALENNSVVSQGLLAPETVSLSPKPADALRNNIPELEALGFGISDFGADTFIIDALPAGIGDLSSQAILPDIAAALESGGARKSATSWAREQIAKTACHSAVNAQNELTRPELEQLVTDLARTEMPYTCPHGRPTLIFMGFSELKKKFGRT